MAYDVPQISFGGGEMSPSVFSRIDLQKFGSGAAKLSNYFVHAEGGASNRAGTEFVHEVKDNANQVRLIKFDYNEQQAYALEFGHEYIRLVSGGGMVLEADKTILSVTRANPAVVGVTGHGFSDGDEIFIKDIVGTTQLNGGYCNVANVTTDTFELSGVDASAYGAYVSGGKAARVYEIATPYQSDDLALIKIRQSNDVLYLTHRNHKPRKLGRHGATNWILEEINFIPLQQYPKNIGVTANSAGSETFRYTVTAVAEETGEESLVGTGVSATITGATKANPIVISATAHGFSDGDDIHLDAIVGMTELNGRRFVVANKATNSFELKGEDGTAYSAYVSDGTAVQTFKRITNGKDAGWKNTITWDEAEGAASYNIYKDVNGLVAFVGSAEGTSYVDDNIAADLEDTAPKLRQPFGAPGNYPGCVGLHEQRTAWGNTDEGPLNMWLSQTSQFENMSVSSPLKATDAVSMRLVTGKGNEIRHFRSFDDKMFIFTSGAIWTLGPGGDSDAITPASKKLTVQEYLASTEVPPLTIKKNILMVAGQDNKGFEVHSIGEDVQSGLVGQYAGSDLTVLSRHLFEGHTIKEWCYIERPYRLVLAVRDDGKLLCLTFLNEHQIYAWSVLETNGIFESVCEVPEGQEDTAYFQVKRTVNGQEKRYIERLHSRMFSDVADAFFVDCGLTYEGPATKTLSGLEHLEGETLIALVDGNLEKDLVVTNASVTLINKGSKIHIGLPYQGQIDSLPIDVGEGQSIAKKKNINAVTCRMHKTRGLYAGPQGGTMEEIASREYEDWNQPAAMISDMKRIPIASDWGRSKSISIMSEPGLPSTILSITPEVNVGGN